MMDTIANDDAIMFIVHTLGLQTVFLYTAEPTMDSAPIMLRKGVVT